MSASATAANDIYAALFSGSAATSRTTGRIWRSTISTCTRNPGTPFLHWTRQPAPTSSFCSDQTQPPFLRRADCPYLFGRATEWISPASHLKWPSTFRASRASSFTTSTDSGFAPYHWRRRRNSPKLFRQVQGAWHQRKIEPRNRCQPTIHPATRLRLTAALLRGAHPLHG